MPCCCSIAGASAERQFSEKRAAQDLAQYRSKGPGATARLLLAGLAEAGPVEGRLLDIGSGIGSLTFELLDRGLTSAIGVDLFRRTSPPRWTRPCVGDDRAQWNLFTVILLTLPAPFHGRMSSLWTASCVVTRTASDSSMNRSVMQSGSWRCRARETSGTSGSGFGFRTLGGRSAETPSARSFIPRRRWRAKFAARVSNCSGAAARGPGALTYT